MKRLKLFFKKPQKEVKLDKDTILVAEHKGDVNYARFVKFKQLAPQFWERMDSPLFVVYKEKIDNAFNNSEWMKGYAAFLDYGLALSQLDKSYDAWGLCFALISYEEGEEIEKELNDVELAEKLARMTKKGLTADVIKEGVVNFMKASPETFQDHLILLEVANTMIETEK
jgi:hypothetical protein